MAPLSLARAVAGLALAAALAPAVVWAQEEAPAVEEAVQPPPELCVGRAPGACDVIGAGQGLPPYLAEGGAEGEEPTLAVIGEGEDTVVFYVVADKAPLAAPVNLFGVATEKIAMPKITTNFSKDGLNVGGTGMAEVTFNCLEKGDTKVMFMLKSHPSQTSLSFALTKSCAGVQKSQDEVK